MRDSECESMGEREKERESERESSKREFVCVFVYYYTTRKTLILTLKVLVFFPCSVT